MSMVAETLTETETDTEGIDDVSSSDDFLEHDGLSAEAGLTKRQRFLIAVLRCCLRACHTFITASACYMSVGARRSA